MIIDKGIKTYLQKTYKKHNFDKGVESHPRNIRLASKSNFPIEDLKRRHHQLIDKKPIRKS